MTSPTPPHPGRDSDGPRLRDAAPADFPAELELNAESVHFLSPLDGARLAELHGWAAYHRVVEIAGEVAAFLLAFRAGTPYDSPNYRWFGERYERFLYIDRVVVRRARRGLGLGARLYDDIVGFAAANGDPFLTCEFDVEPPNPVSQRFHQRFGFREVGAHWIHGGKKRVSLQERRIAIGAEP